MENEKRQKLVQVQIINGQCVLTPLKPQNKDSRPPATNLILHKQLRKEMTPNTSTYQSHANTSQKDPMVTSNVRKIAKRRMESVATQTIAAGGDNACLGDILNKLNEIHREQQYANKKIADMDRQIKLIRSELDMVADRVAPRAGIVRATSFEFEPIGTKEELDGVEQKLLEQNYLKKMREFLDARLPTDSVEARLHESIDILFKRDFVVQMSWTGMGHPNPKIAFNKCTNLLKLYRYIGTCHGLIPTDSKIKTFLQNKFRHSGQRVNLVGIVKTSFHNHSKQ